MNRIPIAMRLGALSLALGAGACSSAWIDTLACASPDGPYGPNTGTCERAHDKLRRDREDRLHQAQENARLEEERARRMKDPAYRAKMARIQAEANARTEKRNAEVQAAWRRELAAAGKENKRDLAAKYPDLAWLSGIWCRTNPAGYAADTLRFTLIDSKNLDLVEYKKSGFRYIKYKSAMIIKKKRGFEIMEFDDKFRTKRLLKIKKLSNNAYRITGGGRYSFNKLNYNRSLSTERGTRRRLESKEMHAYQKCG